MIRHEPLSSQSDDVIQQAVAWTVQLDRNDLSPDEIEQFSAWLSEDPRHEIEFQKASMVWSGVPRQAISLYGTEDLSLLDKLETFFSQRKGQWLAASMACIVLLISAFLVIQFNAPAVDSFETAHAERRTIKLEDGSEVFMNGETKLSIHYTERLRLVTLDQGEAFFDVAKDASRPFIVDLKSGTARALGTKFNIRADTQHTKVSVVEGRVEVKHENTISTDERVSKTILEVGQQIAYDSTGSATLEAINVNQIATWRHGRVTFDNQELETIIAEVNRYRKVPIIFADPELKQRRLSGSFGIDKTDDFLLALQTLSVAEVVDRGDSIALIMIK